MKNEDLKKAMSDIRDEFILEAAPDAPAPQRTPLWRRPWFGSVTALAAACFVLVLGLGIYRRTRPQPKQSAPTQNDLSVAGKAEPPAAAAQDHDAEAADMIGLAFEAEMEPVPMTEAVSEALSEALTESDSEDESEGKTEAKAKTKTEK